MSLILQEGAVGSVRVSGLVRSADPDPSGEPGTRGAGRHLLQHAHAAVDAQHRGHAPSAQKGKGNKSLTLQSGCTNSGQFIP